MDIRKKSAITIAGLGFAGMTAFTLGPAVAANAQTAPASSHSTVTAAQGCWGDDCGWGWDDDDWGWYGDW
jgi:hypothetical protein